jgi:protocatechuate 3,4-dioxygenase beta subunit
MAQVVGATLSGTIVGTSGATVPNVTVTIKNTETGIVRSATTNAAGLYSAANLQPGNYEVTASATGFGS